MGPLSSRGDLLANLFTLPGKDDFHVVPDQPVRRTEDDAGVAVPKHEHVPSELKPNPAAEVRFQQPPMLRRTG